MKAVVGDHIVIDSEKVGQTRRRGVVEEVLAADPPRLRVRWEDGHSSVFAPTAGAAKVEPAMAKPAKAKSAKARSAKAKR